MITSSRSIFTHRLGFLSFVTNNCWRNRRNKEALNEIKVHWMKSAASAAQSFTQTHPRQKRREEIRSQISLSLLKERVYFTGNTDMQQDHYRFIKTRIIKALVLFHQTMIRLIFEIDSRNVHVNSIACKSLWYEEQIHALLFDFNDSYDKPNDNNHNPLKICPQKHTLTSTTIYQ